MDVKTGDVVVLKSGGPKMTIAAVKADRAFCVWFNRREESYEEQSGEFLIATLQPLQPRARAPQPSAKQAAPPQRVGVAE